MCLATAKIGAIIGTVGGPTLLVFAYLAITFAYSSEKRMIIQQLKQHLTLEDTADDPAAIAALPLHVQKQHLHHAKSSAAQVAAGCLSRWDGLLGLRAKVDSNGKRSGIWMDKFETVRFGCMLLAFQRVNAKRKPQGKLTCLLMFEVMPPEQVQQTCCPSLSNPAKQAASIQAYLRLSPCPMPLLCMILYCTVLCCRLG